MTEELTAEDVRRQRDYLMETLRQIAASDPQNSQFAVLVLAGAREAIAFIDEGLV